MQVLAAHIAALASAIVITTASLLMPKATAPSIRTQDIHDAPPQQIEETRVGWLTAVARWMGTEPEVYIASQEPQHPQRPPEREVHGIYLTSYSAANPKKIDWLIELSKTTEVNAVVIDIKDYSGKIAYDSDVPLVNELQTEEHRIKDIREVIKRLHDAGIYVIARTQVFQDPELSSKKPEWAVKNSKHGGIWRDKKGISWLDPTVTETWDYNIAIAREAIGIGFDEINFDYIRFPSDGDMSAVSYAHMDGRARWEVMRSFFAYLREQLDDEPAYLSADLFGFTTEKADDLTIGQQIEDAIAYFDYVCPMVYPSHYPSGYLSLANPAAHPYTVVRHAIQKGTDSIAVVPDRRGKIRPWLQDFDLGADYTPQMVRDQIRASAESGGYGWLIWNARNVYQTSALEK